MRAFVLSAAAAGCVLAACVGTADSFALPPADSRTPGPIAAAARRPVFCYVETLFGGATAADLDFRPCTHVIEAFAVVDPSGALQTTNGLPRRDLISAARAAGARVMVAVGGATVPGTTFSAIARDKVRLSRFVADLSNLVAQAGYDGVDLDWEFPTPEESSVHLALVGAIRSALARLAVSRNARQGRPANLPSVVRGEDAPVVTVPVAAYWIPSFNLAALYDVADYVILMGYDFKNPALGPWANDARLWPVGATTPIEGSVRGAAAEMIRAGVGYDRLIIAFPFYTSALQPWIEVRDRALASRSPLDPQFLEKLIDGVWVTDPEALERKIRAALFDSQISGGNAAGIGIWQLGHQGRSRDLTDAMVRALARP